MRMYANDTNGNSLADFIRIIRMDVSDSHRTN